MKKILIADDHPMARKGLVTLLKGEWPQVEVFEARDGNEVIAAYPTFNPDLLILDYRMPTLTGYEAAKEILQVNSTARIILLTMFDSIPIAMNFLRIGGKGFLSKGSEVEHIIKAINTVAQGDIYFHSDNEEELLHWFQMGMAKNVPAISFTPRELQVCFKVSKGLINKEIAEELKISVRTVETYRQQLIAKTNVRNTAELVEYIYKNGIG
ncbi:MAG: response regulator transcription factor [Cyclobacteriaceae bacterium]